MPTSIPRKIEAVLPQGVPSISGLMSKIANSVPDLGGTTSLRFPRVTPIISKVEESVPGMPKVSEVINRVEGPIASKMNQLTAQRAKVAGDALRVAERPSEITENPEGLRTAVPGMSAFTTAHLMQSVDMQGARGSL
jgi:hypothetical protein